MHTSPILVSIGETVPFELLWDTTGYEPGNYRAIAWVEYDSQITDPVDPTKFHVTSEKAADINMLEP
ncbi:hypothetical protein ES707_08404 [subsurface metagenome]